MSGQTSAEASVRALAKRKLLATMEPEQPVPAGSHDPNTAKPKPPPISPAQQRRASAAVHRRRLAERDASRRDWEIRLEADETLEEVLTPPFFALSADRLQPGDRICVLGYELTWWCELIVTRADSVLNAVWTVVLHPRIELTAQTTFDPSRYQIEQVGNDWRIVHGQTAIVSGLPSKIAAERWLARRATDGASG